MNFQERAAIVCRLQENFLKKGVDVLAVDLDDTLVDTSEEYTGRMKIYSGDIASRVDVSMDVVWEFMKEMLNGLLPTYNVHPNLMQETARITTLRFGCDFYSKEFRQATGRLMEIYESVPQIFPGVPETLGIIKETDTRIVVVTNCDDEVKHEWTDKKLTQDQLYRSINRVINIPSHIRKDKCAWGGVLNDLNTKASRVLVVGDSWSSDIQPALELGVPKENIVRVKTSYSHANQGAIAGIREVDRFEEVINVWLGD